MVGRERGGKAYDRPFARLLAGTATLTSVTALHPSRRGADARLVKPLAPTRLSDGDAAGECCEAGGIVVPAGAGLVTPAPG